MSVAEYRFNLEVFLPFNKVRWGSVEVRAMGFGLSIRAKERSVEDVIYIP